MDAAGLLADEARLEKYFRATEALATDGDDVAVRQLVGLLLVRTLSGSLHFCVEVQGNVAELLLDVTHDLTLSRRGERVTTLCENIHEIFCEVTTCEIKAQDGMWQRIAF